MKRYLLIVLALCLVLGGCTKKGGTTTPTPSATAPTAPEGPKLKTVYVHTSITREVGNTINRTEYLYDAQDRVTEVLAYTNGQETNRHSVECDEYGNFIKWISADGKVTEYSYDDSGHSLGYAIYNGMELISSVEYTWDGDLRTSVTNKIPSGGMEQRAALTYDNQGNLIRQDTFVNGTLSNYAVYTTDAKGRVSTVETFLPDGTLSLRSTYVWEKNTETVTITLPDGTVNQIVETTYDGSGNLLSQIVMDGQNNVFTKEIHTWKAIQVPVDCPRASV